MRVVNDEVLIELFDKNAAETRRLFEEAWRHADAVAEETRLHMDRSFAGVDKKFKNVDKNFENVDKNFKELNHKIGIVAEGVILTADKIDQLSDSVAQLTTRMENVEVRLAVQESKIDQLEADMKAGFVEVHLRIDRLEPPTTH